MLDREVNRFSKYVGTFAFGWRIILTTGTGSIFGFLVATKKPNIDPVPVVNIILHPNANVPTYLENLFTSLSSIVQIYAAKTTANPE